MLRGVESIRAFTIVTARKRSCGKVMFLQVSVILFTGGSGLGGICSQGAACSRGVPGEDPPTATAAGGTHPTGMHSCFVPVKLDPLPGVEQTADLKITPETFGVFLFRI